jgi:hypothetical protein
MSVPKVRISPPASTDDKGTLNAVCANPIVAQSINARVRTFLFMFFACHMHVSALFIIAMSNPHEKQESSLFVLRLCLTRVVR